MQPRARTKAKKFNESRMFQGLMLTLLALALVACGAGGGGGTNVNISGSGVVGVSSGGDYGFYGGGSGPPPGRTASERQARKEYYRGPRGQEF